MVSFRTRRTPARFLQERNLKKWRAEGFNTVVCNSEASVNRNGVGRWREDVINSDGQLARINRKEILGTKSDFPTKKLAMRELELRIAPINSINYRALRTATFAEFAVIWKENALTQHKQSTQLAVRSQLKKWLVPNFGSCAMREVGGQTIQMFIQRCSLAPKSCRNLVLTLRMM